jgi:hypothetical protein
MSENTTNVEGLVFTAKDEASGVADKIGKSFERLHHAAEGAREKVGEFAHHAATGALASMGLGLGLHAIYEKAKEANLEMDHVRKSVAGAQFGFQGWRPGISQLEKMNHSMGQSVEIVEDLEKMELKLRTPLEDLGQTFDQVAALGYGKLGMNQKQVVELTEEMTAAAKVYGISGSEAVATVTRGLMTGKIRGFGPFQMAMRDAMDIGTTGKSKGPVNTEEMFKRLERGLKGMVPVAQKIGDNMAGSMFEAKALVNKMLEELGGPIFREQSKSLGEWVQKLRTVKEDGQSIMQIYGEKIAGAFRTIKSATGFIVDHWKLLLGMFAASKFAGALGGFASKLASAGGSAGVMASATGVMNVSAGVVNVGSGLGAKIGDGVNTALKPGMVSVAGKFAGVASKALVVTEALGALYLGLNAAAQMVDNWQTKNIEKEARWGEKSALGGSEGKRAARHMESFRDLLSGGGFRADWRDGAEKAKETMTAYQATYGQDVIKKTGEVNAGLAMKAWETMSADVRASQSSALGLAQSATGEEFVAKLGEMTKLLAGLLPAATEVSPNIARKVPKGHGDINIQNLTITQDFKEADPDRIFHRVTNDIASLANSPGKARTGASMPGGF